MKILLAIDGSRYAGEAVRLLRSLARERSFHVDMVAVVPEPDSIGGRLNAGVATASGSDGAPGSGSAGTIVSPRIEDQVPVDVASGWLEAAASDLEAVGIGVGTDIVHGVPEVALLERCRSGEHDLVVAGVKGRGAAPFFEVGRVARHLVRWSPISVLLVRERVARAGTTTASSQDRTGFRVLVPTDGNAGSLEASWRMVESLTPSDAGVEIVRVVEPSQARTPIPAGEATWTAGSGETRESAMTTGGGEAREPTRRWASSEPTGSGRRGPRPESTILRGRPAAAIARWATWNHSDLVVLGLRKPDGSGPCLLGRTARELTWSSPCSVLMVRD